MIRRISLKDIKISNYILKNVEDDCPFSWKSKFAECKSLSDFVKLINYELCIFGCVIISDLNTSDLDTNLKRNLFLGLCSQLGTPVEHNPGKKDYIWDIKLRNEISCFPTFSEHNLEAPLHTDNQYRVNPERYISLFVLERAACGGGATTILRLKDIINTLRKTKDGRECLSILENSLFPFATPSVFSENKNEDHIVFAPIICDERSIRYRFDTIERGLRHSKLSDEDIAIKIWALNFFRNHIEAHPSTMRLLLENGEMLFLENRTVLHGRTRFADPNRHILRVRMDEL
ncbi:TauD/TfdA family dioxygenase [Oscillatoria salina]|uniref:TauD/TfdA family dioxygenase n=1 Tax=Oscillatoria salina TaxID=331517 RepID=UPI001CC982C3|nr:TauD/TfdA family dioxygenase [Oscillatoria salina]MBZ8178626.1 hypothetical protein [Oscillatoria salina IIICB1]